MSDRNSRTLFPISENFKVLEWTCSNWAWRKKADDPTHITVATIALFIQHRCEEYPSLK